MWPRDASSLRGVGTFQASTTHRRAGSSPLAVTRAEGLRRVFVMWLRSHAAAGARRRYYSSCS